MADLPENVEIHLKYLGDIYFTFCGFYVLPSVHYLRPFHIRNLIPYATKYFDIQLKRSDLEKSTMVCS